MATGHGATGEQRRCVNLADLVVGTAHYWLVFRPTAEAERAEIERPHHAPILACPFVCGDGTFKDCSLEVVSLEVGSQEVGFLEVGSLEVGSLEVGSQEVGILEVGILEVGSLEVGSLSFVLLVPPFGVLFDDRLEFIGRRF